MGDEESDDEEDDNLATADFKRLNSPFKLSVSASSPAWANSKFLWVRRSSSSLTCKLARVDLKAETEAAGEEPEYDDDDGSDGDDGEGKAKGERPNGDTEGVTRLASKKTRGMREGCGDAFWGALVCTVAVIVRCPGIQPRTTLSERAMGFII